MDCSQTDRHMSTHGQTGPILLPWPLAREVMKGSRFVLEGLIIYQDPVTLSVDDPIQCSYTCSNDSFFMCWNFWHKHLDVNTMRHCLHPPGPGNFKILWNSLTFMCTGQLVNQYSYWVAQCTDICWLLFQVWLVRCWERTWITKRKKTPLRGA